MGIWLKKISALPFQSGPWALCFRGLLIAAILVPVAGVGSINYFTTRDTLTKTAMSRRQSTAFLAAATLKERFKRMHDVAQLALASRVQFYDMLKTRRWSEAGKLLNTLPSDLPFVDRILLAGSKGNINNETGLISDFEEKDPDFAAWRETLAKEGKPYISNIYRTEDNASTRNVIALAVPLRPSSVQNLEGVLLLEVSLDTLLRWAQEIDVGIDGFLYFVDRKGHVAGHPQYPSQAEIIDFSALPEVQKVLRGESGVGTFRSPVSSEKHVVAYEPVSGYGWGVIVGQPVSAAFAVRNHFMKRLLWIYAVIFVLGCGLTLFMLYAIRIRRETEAALKKAHDELEVKVDERTHELACSNDILRHEIKRRQNAEDSLHDAVDKLKESNQELEQFAFVASHDLQEPLRKISAFGDLLDKVQGLDTEGRDYVQRMRSAALRMSDLIKSLLELSRVTSQAKPFEPIDLKSVIQNVLSDLDMLIAESKASVKILGDWPVLKADPIQIRQLFSNLISNAIKFHKKDAAPKVVITCRIADQERSKSVSIDFTDEGVGFDMRFKDEIFHPFRRLHRREEYDGSGMGLAICYKIAARHGAKISVKSEPDKGSTFTVTFLKIF